MIKLWMSKEKKKQGTENQAWNIFNLCDQSQFEVNDCKYVQKQKIRAVSICAVIVNLCTYVPHVCELAIST